MNPYSLYFHVPFCTHRCAYCDFNTYAGQEEMIPAYVDALNREINYVGQQLKDHETSRLAGNATKVHTIFFGGGTTSLLSPLQFDSIFKSIHSAFDLTSDAEISIEANPGMVTEEALRQLRKIGINRISFGVQSANLEELRMLERTHDFFTVIEAVTSDRKAGFDNLNLDLIYALPEQTLQTWQTTVQRILDSRISDIEFPLSPTTVNQHKQTSQDDMSEFMMTGFRLTQEGVSENEFQARFGKSLRDVYKNEIEELLKLELIESKTSEFSKNSEVLRLTKRGRLLGNQVFMRFV